MVVYKASCQEAHRASLLGLQSLIAWLRWHLHLNNFPQFVVIHTVKGFIIVNEAEVNEFSYLFQSIVMENPKDNSELPKPPIPKL